MAKNLKKEKEVYMNWKVTATTIKCDKAGEFVTLLVHPDGKAECVYYREKGKKNGCDGPLCPEVLHYRDELLKEG
jgi:hypothetical protein